MNRRLSAALIPAAAGAVGVLVVIDVVREVQLGTADAIAWFSAAATCVALASAVLVGRWPERRRMALLILFWVLSGVVIDAASDWPGSRIAVTAWLLALALQAPAYAQMALAYPAGRVRDRIERAFLVLAYVVSLLWQLAPALFADFRCAGCTPHVGSLLFTGHVIDLTWVGKVFSILFIGLGVAFIALMVRRLRQAPPGARRTLLPLVAAACFTAAQFIALRAATLTDWSQAFATLDWIGNLNTLVVPAAIFVGIATIRRHRGPLGDLVIELAAAPPDQISMALARAIGDPTLKLALWLPDRQQFVNEHGVPVTIDPGSPDRAVTLIGPEHQPLAAIVHDARLLDQRPLLEAAGSAARLALENARLNAELRAQLSELRESRGRIVAAGDAERRRLERDLHDGAQQRLLALGLALQLLRDNQADPQLLTEAQTELQQALRELRQLARGIHPAILTDNGLAAAVGSLVDRAQLPISAHVTDQRYPAAVESTAYFVVSEALANIAKHAHAHTATVTVAPDNGRLIVAITDDGHGGATSAGGGGLEGLADRVGALNGLLTITSAAGAGTTIRAEIPCGS